MTNSDLYPYRFKPVYKDYVWGGTRIGARFNRRIDGDVCAESWELSARQEGMSILANGPLAGVALDELVTRLGASVLGTRPFRDDRYRKAPAFPLLVKLIDASKRLSLQVHPSNASAARYGGEPKTEMWTFLESTPGARVFAGLRVGVDRRQFENAVRSGNLEPLLHEVPAEPGTALFIPGGLVHAIDSGCLLLEIQQNSNTTYRVYDWGRLGKDGKPRETHVDEALRTIDWSIGPAGAVTPGQTAETKSSCTRPIVNSPFFDVSRVDLKDRHREQHDGGSFRILFVAEGALTVECATGTVEIPEGTTCLLPAGLTRYTLVPADDPVTLYQVERP